MGGDGENARRSIVNVAMVASTSARRSGVMRSMAWHFTHTRWGGRWRVPQAWQRLPVNANFHASDRNDGGASGGWGSGRRGGSRRRKPRHVSQVWNPSLWVQKTGDQEATAVPPSPPRTSPSRSLTRFIEAF